MASSGSSHTQSALFLSVAYVKEYKSHDHILTEVSISITTLQENKKIIDRRYKHLGEVDTNEKRIDILDINLHYFIKEHNIPVVYVYGDNKIFHNLSALKLPQLRVIDIKTFHNLKLSDDYDTNLARNIARQKNKEYPSNRYSMQSVINLCGLIAQNYIIRYSRQEKKLYPNQRVNDIPKCMEYNDVNVFRVILYDYCTFLLTHSYSTYFIEPLFQQMLLDMFYPKHYNYSLYPTISFDEEKEDEGHKAIIRLEEDILQMGDVNHNPEGLKYLDYLYDDAFPQ